MEQSILYQKTYDLILYMYKILGGFPKYEKFTLQTQLKNCLFEFIRKIIKAGKSKTKLSHYYEADSILDEFRTLIRLARDLRYMDNKRYKYICGKITEIGNLLGGTIKQAQATK